MKKISTLIAATAMLLVHSYAFASVHCPGDCDKNNVVTVDEVLTGVNIALGSSSVDRCTEGDVNGDHNITVDELLAAVNSALRGCPALPTPTPTVDITPLSTRTCSSIVDGGICVNEIAGPFIVGNRASVLATYTINGPASILFRNRVINPDGHVDWENQNQHQTDVGTSVAPNWVSDVQLYKSGTFKVEFWAKLLPDGLDVLMTTVDLVVIDIDTPTPEPTITPTTTVTVSPTATFTATVTVTNTSTHTATPTHIATNTNTPTQTATRTFTPTATATATPSFTVVPSATPTATATPTPVTPCVAAIRLNCFDVGQSGGDTVSQARQAACVLAARKIGTAVITSGYYGLETLPTNACNNGYQGKVIAAMYLNESANDTVERGHLVDDILSGCVTKGLIGNRNPITEKGLSTTYLAQVITTLRNDLSSHQISDFPVSIPEKVSTYLNVSYISFFKNNVSFIEASIFPFYDGAVDVNDALSRFEGAIAALRSAYPDMEIRVETGWPFIASDPRATAQNQRDYLEGVMQIAAAQGIHVDIYDLEDEAWLGSPLGNHGMCDQTTLNLKPHLVDFFTTICAPTE